MPSYVLPATYAGTELNDLTVAVYIAPGADLTAAWTTWTFTDVTETVLFSNPVTITMGRGDEQSEAQTATCNFTLLNDTGDYTPRRPGSVFYPNMRLGFPVRVVANSTATGTCEMFAGFVDELKPMWDETGKIPTVEVTAKGSLQRLQQGKKTLSGSMSLAATSPNLLSTVAAYWPGTDGADALQLGSGLSGGSPMTVNGTMTYASYSGFPGTEPIAVFGTSTNIGGDVDNRRANTTGKIYFRCLLQAASVLPDKTALLQIVTTGGTATYWYLYYLTGGGLSVAATTSGYSELFTTGPIGFNIDGDAFEMGVELVQSGSNISVKMTTQQKKADGTFGALSFTTTYSSATLGKCTHIDMGGNGTMSGWAIGQIGVANSASWLPISSDVFTAYSGEVATTRITRLCGEFGVPANVVGSSAVRMGSQGLGSFVDAISDAEAADHGLLYDGEGFGIVYLARASRHNASVALALDVLNGDVMPPFAPVENTRLLRNDITVSRDGGSSATASQGTGDPYDPAMVGTFSDSYTLNLFNDDTLIGHATWLLHLGTVDLDRYPNLELDFSASPTLTKRWLLAGVVGGRITVTNLPATGGTDPDLFIEGYTLVLSDQEFTFSANCSPAAPYSVAVVNTDRVDSAGSTLATAAVLGATSLSVTVSSPWSTSAGSFLLSVGGYKVTCSAISGASSPQTFTVTSMPAPVPAGAVVKLWNPATVALGA